MAILLPNQIAKYAYQAGLRNQGDLTKAVAIAMGESGGNTNAIGDVSLQNGTWGPSVGLWQVRSLKAEKGKGTSRDENKLKDPTFNAQSMYSISGGGKNWTPWTVYNQGIYLIHMPIATAAVAAYMAGEGISQSVDDVAESAESAADMASAVPEALDATYGWVSNRKNWIRVAQVMIGGVIIVAGVAYIAQGSVGGVTKMVVKGVTKGAV